MGLVVNVGEGVVDVVRGFVLLFDDELFGDVVEYFFGVNGLLLDLM